MAKKKIGCLGTTLIIILVIVLILGAAALIVANMTPEKLGFADMALFNGQSLRDMGLADTKIKELIPIVMSLVNPPKEGDIITNAPAQEDAAAADGKLGGSSLLDPSTGKPDYSGILDGKVTFTEKGQLDIKDRELAYIFNSVLQSAASDAAFDSLRELNATIAEITLYSQDGKIYMRAVLKADIAQYVSQVNIPLVTLSDTLYLTVTNEVSVTADGKAETSPTGVAVNGQDERISGLILDGVLAAAGGSAGTAFTKDDICDGVGELFSRAMLNLGKIGTYADEAETLGITGINTETHTISLVTYTEA